MSCLRGSEVMAAETVHSCRSFSFSEKAKPLIGSESVGNKAHIREEPVCRSCCRGFSSDLPSIAPLEESEEEEEV